MHSFLAPFLFITLAFTAANFDVKTTNKTKKTKKNEKKLPNSGRFVLPFKPEGHLIPGINVTNETDAIVIVFSNHSGSPSMPNRGGFICPKPNTCLGRCTNKRQFDIITGERDFPVCFCDPECNSVFHDCCADYEKHCNAVSQLRNRSHEWACFMVPGFSFGVWLIESCEPTWSDKELREKCTTTSAKELGKASIMIPVIDENDNTFRNRYCAQCNGVDNFVPWTFKGMICNSTLTNYSSEKGMRFWDDDCNIEKINFVSQTRAIRYCYDVQGECKYHHNPEAVEKCKTATAGLMNMGNRTYRNLDCLRCNLKNRVQLAFLKISCGPQINSSVEQKIFISFAKLFQMYSARIPQSPVRCPPGFLYDIVVPGHCRKLVTTLGRLNLPNKLLKRYAVRMRYEPNKSSACLPDGRKSKYAEIPIKIQRQFGAAFKRNLNIKLSANNRNWQISDLEVHVWDNASSLVTFQILLYVSTADNETAPRFRLPFFEIKSIYFPLYPTATSIICKYYLLRNVVQEMRCKENRTYEVGKPGSSIQENGTVFVNETKEHYSVGQYLQYRQENKTWLAVCKDFRPANCSYYLDIKNRTLWDMFQNRSIYSNVTESLFDYGEYSIVDGTLWLCLTKEHLADDKQIPRVQNSVHTHILSYITLVSLTISIVSLAVLLTVYSVFPSLRNLPGKNLMLLSSVLGVSQLLWLLQHEVYSLSSTACVVTSVVLQYLFLTTFCCSSSIAFHSFTTFHGIAKGKLGPRKTEGNAFLWYAMHSLGSPLVLVALCWLLDFFNVISIGYGGGQGHCWLAASKHGMYLAFFAPLFCLLAINFALFLATARVIHNCTKASRDLAEKSGAPNKKQVGVYLRMSTVIGFTWLFGLFQLIFPKVVVFEYLFVIFNGFQGFYIATAFLFTYNVKKMVFKCLSKISSTSSTQNTAKTAKS